MAFLAPVAAPVLTLWLLFPVVLQPALGGSPIQTPDPQLPARMQTSSCHRLLQAFMASQVGFRLAVPTGSEKPCTHTDQPLFQGLQDPQLECPCIPVAAWLRRPRGEGEPRQRPKQWPSQRLRKPGRRVQAMISHRSSPPLQGTRLSRLRDRRLGPHPPVRSAGQQNAAGPRRRGQRQDRNMGPRLPLRRRRQYLLECLLFRPHHRQSCFRHHRWPTPPQQNTSVPWPHRGDQDRRRRPQLYQIHRGCHLQLWPLLRCPLQRRCRAPGPQHRQRSRPDLRLPMEWSQAGASLSVLSPFSLLPDLRTPGLTQTAMPHRGLSSNLAWMPHLGHTVGVTIRASAYGCQKDLPPLALTALHADLQRPAQFLSPPGQCVCDHSGRACTGWRQPAAFCPALISALAPVLAQPPSLHTGSRAGLRSPRLSQPAPQSSLCPHTLHMPDRLSWSCRLILPCHPPDQARALLGLDCAVCWPIVSAPLPSMHSFDSPSTSRQQPSWTGVPRPLSALRLTTASDMPKSPGKRERERSRPGRLNREFTARDRGIEAPRPAVPQPQLPRTRGHCRRACRNERGSEPPHPSRCTPRSTTAMGSRLSHPLHLTASSRSCSISRGLAPQ